MAERKRPPKKETDIIYNTDIAFREASGDIVTVGKLAQIFEHTRGKPTLQARLAISCLQRPDFNQTYIPKLLSFIVDSGTRELIEGRFFPESVVPQEYKEPEQKKKAKVGIKTPVKPDAPTPIPQIVQDEQQLIDQLGPLIPQIDLARLLVLKRYKEADPITKQTLVIGAYRVLGEYLGPRRVFKREIQVPVLLPLPALPIEIFEEETTSQLLFESERQAALPIFNKSVEEGFRYLTEMKASAGHPVKIKFLESLEQYFKRVVEFDVPGFKQKIAGNQKDIPESQRTAEFSYPSFHQREYAYRLVHKQDGPFDLLIGDTATQKTGASIYAMEAAGAQCTLVVCPPYVRPSWEGEIKEKYEDEVGIVTIEERHDLEKLIASKGEKPRYVIIGYSLLSWLIKTPESRQLMDQLVKTVGVDSLIADEAHLAKEDSADCTQMLLALSKTLPEKAPRIAMTATSIINEVGDLDAQVRVLMPYRYPNPGDFTKACRNDPTLISALLQSQGIMTRWTVESIFGDKLPEVREKMEAVALDPFHHYLYDFVYFDDTIEASTKRMRLRQVSLDPLLVRRYYTKEHINDEILKLNATLDDKQDDRAREITRERIRALQERSEKINKLSNPEQALKDLSDALVKFLAWKEHINSLEKFDEDFLINMGYADTALWAFVNFPEGVDTLVKFSDNQELKKAWQGKEGVYSTKYRRLKENIDRAIDAGDTKILIFSGFLQDQVTTELADLEEVDEYAFFSLYEHLKIWYGDEVVSKIDGKLSLKAKKGEISAREKVRRSWRLNPKVKILLATLRSSRLGIDLTIPDIEVNEEIKHSEIHFLDEPDTHADKQQGVGRERRFGHKTDIDAIYYRNTNPEQPHTLRYGFFDHAVAQHNEYKKLIAQMSYDMIPLTEAEEKFVREHTKNLSMDLYPQTPQMYMRNFFFNAVRGKSREEIKKFLAAVGFEGMTNSDFFAAHYPQHDILTMSGHNARAVSEVIKRYESTLDTTDIKRAAIGAGAGILQFTMGEKFFNFDALPEILPIARDRQVVEGQFVAADAVGHLPVLSEQFQVTDASLMIHWTDNSPKRVGLEERISERVETLKELNRITKKGGLVSISVPHTYLTSEQFQMWVNTLELYFGFKLHPTLPSGLIRATDFRVEDVSWILNLEKVGNPLFESKKISPELLKVGLRFDFENIVDIIGAKPVKNGEAGGYKPTPLLPHREFEIVKPDGEVEGVMYTPPHFGDERDEVVRRQYRPLTSEIEVETELGRENAGMYYRLIKESKRQWGLSKTAAENLALKVMTRWSESGQMRENSQLIYQELRTYLREEYNKQENGT